MLNNKFALVSPGVRIYTHELVYNKEIQLSCSLKITSNYCIVILDSFIIKFLHVFNIYWKKILSIHRVDILIACELPSLIMFRSYMKDYDNIYYA